MSGTTAKRASTLEHWESYWRGHQDLEAHLLHRRAAGARDPERGPVEGRRVLEVGAGSGRDALGLAQAGAIGMVLDYSPASLELVQRQAREAGHSHPPGAGRRAARCRSATAPSTWSSIRGCSSTSATRMPLLERERSRHRPRRARGGRRAADLPSVHVDEAGSDRRRSLVRGMGDAVHAAGARAPGRAPPGLRVRRTYGEWMVPGLCYRVVRETLRRTVGVSLALEPRGPRWWESGWRAWRASLLRRRFALYTCHVIGTVGEKP